MTYKTEKPSEPKILKLTDDYTSRANPMRGYHDQELIVQFEPGSTWEDQRNRMEKFASPLRESNMWCYGPSNIGPDTWRINYGYDSGD